MARRATKKIPVARVQEFPPGARRIIDVDGRSIGVLNVDGEYFALRNSCPHQGAPLCLGRVTGTSVGSTAYERVYSREGEILKCPWHGWEFELATGRSVFNPHKIRTKTYEVTVEIPDDDDEDPSIDTFPVTIEQGVVMLHV